MSQQIMALGGGGFSTHSELGLDEYILAEANCALPRIGFIGTASGDAALYIKRFYARFSALDCKPSHLELFADTQPVDHWLQQQDIVFVGGGNTKSMLAVWREWELPRHLNSALENGVILSGISAGAICWFDSGVTDSIEGDYTVLPCLGFLDGSCCPHYTLEPQRKPTYERMLENNEISAGLAIDDGALVHFVDGQVKAVVSGNGTASAYSVSSTSGQVHTSELAAQKITLK